MFKILRQVLQGEHLENFRQFCESLNPTTKQSRSSFCPGRPQRWIKSGCNFQSGKRFKIFTPPSVMVVRPSDRLDKFCRRFVQDWDSACCTADKGIDWHKDHPMFQEWCVMVNLGEANFYINPNRSFNLKQAKAGYLSKEAECYHLTDGMIVAYNARYWHCTQVPPMQEKRRMSLIIRCWQPGWEEYICDYIQRLPENWK